MYFKILGFILLGYLCGNFNFARIITKIKAKKQVNSGESIDNAGSGNPGTMNMLRTHGAISGVVTLIADALKSAIPALVAFYVFGGLSNMPDSKIALYITGLFAILGHIYPVFYNFKGGKGIACTVGVFFVANPIAALCIFAVCLIFFIFVKIGSLTSFLFIFSFAVFETFWNKNFLVLEFVILIWVIIALDVWAHRQNIKRLFLKSERIASLQEGVKKDIEKIRARKVSKMENLESKKNEDLKNEFNEKKEKIDKKYAKKENKLQQKFESKENKINKRQTKVSTRYENKENKAVKKVDKKVARIEKFIQNDKQNNEKQN